MKRHTILLASAAFSVMLSAQAQSQIAGGAVASNAYITQSGLDWAWANPLPADAGYFLISGFQASEGWRLPTAAELLFAPLATDFLFSGGYVPFNGSGANGATFSATNGSYNNDGACASPWFSTVFLHCDWQDGNGQLYGPWAGTPDAESFGDQLVVRGDAVETVPEPATIILFGSGLLGLGVFARRRRSA